MCHWTENRSFLALVHNTDWLNFNFNAVAVHKCYMYQTFPCPTHALCYTLLIISTGRCRTTWFKVCITGSSELPLLVLVHVLSHIFHANSVINLVDLNWKAEHYSADSILLNKCGRNMRKADSFSHITQTGFTETLAEGDSTWRFTGMFKTSKHLIIPCKA